MTLKKIKKYNIHLSSTNTVVNINNIKGNPKFFYSAGMFSLQKIRQLKAIMTILRTSLLKSKIYKTKPVAVHFNNLFFNYQSYIFKKLKQKILKNHKKKEIEYKNYVQALPYFDYVSMIAKEHSYCLAVENLSSEITSNISANGNSCLFNNYLI